MGRRGSPNAVLDSKLRVQGLGGLRVIDASIMPTVVSTNSQAACMVIGEVGADMILTTWAENEQNELYV
jgi:choline dehydrogenase